MSIVTLTPQSGDYGIDVFADRDNERIAIQAKMYGGTARKINRTVVMELEGARKFADCTAAAIVTDGNVLADARAVADKLGIAIIYLAPETASRVTSVHATDPGNDKPSNIGGSISFDQIWHDYVMPLRGKNIELMSGDTNRILSVDQGSIKRISKNGCESYIPIEPFRFAVNRLLSVGRVTAQDILDSDKGRYSRGVFAILARVPLFELEKSTPPALRYRKK